MAYVGRFAPSPTGPLHAGSLVAALASWLDAQAHGGRWLVRIEDVDTPRCVPAMDHVILGQLAACGLLPDETPVWQSQRNAAYAAALAALAADDAVYRCVCSRRQIAEHWEALGQHKPRHAEWPYPGTCRERVDIAPAAAHAIRLRCGNPLAPVHLTWRDRRLREQRQNLSEAVGDFVLKRADGVWAYQLAVVVDDAAQGISDVVRGEDLADNTPRQIHLQHLLGLPTPRYLHTPLVLGADGAKLSKQNGAFAFDSHRPLSALQQAGRALGLAHAAESVPEWLALAVPRWAALWPTQTTTPAAAAAPDGRSRQSR